MNILNPLFCRFYLLLPGNIQIGAKVTIYYNGLTVRITVLVSKGSPSVSVQSKVLIAYKVNTIITAQAVKLCGQLVQESAWIKLGNPGKQKRPRGAT